MPSPDSPPAAPPDPWPSHFAQALAEALAGTRPPGQLTPWTTIQARKRITRLAPMLASPQRPRLRRVIASSPAPDVLELAIVINDGPRVRAIAARLERHPTPAPDQALAPRATTAHPPAPEPRWTCTAIEAA